MNNSKSFKAYLKTLNEEEIYPLYYELLEEEKEIKKFMKIFSKKSNKEKNLIKQQHKEKFVFMQEFNSKKQAIETFLKNEEKHELNLGINTERKAFLEYFENKIINYLLENEKKVLIFEDYLNLIKKLFIEIEAVEDNLYLYFDEFSIEFKFYCDLAMKEIEKELNGQYLDNEDLILIEEEIARKKGDRLQEQIDKYNELLDRL